MKQQEIKKIFETITNETPNIIILKDYEGNFVYGNETLAKLYGTTTEDLIGKTDSDFNPNTKQTDFYLKNIQNIMNNNKTEVVLEESTNNVTGETHYFHSVKKPFLDSDGNKSILVIANDITEIQESKLELEEKKNRLDSAFDIIGEGVWDWNIKTNIIKHNYQWCNMFHLDNTKQEHPLEFFASIIYKKDKEKVALAINEAIENKKDYFSEHRIVCGNGEIKWVEDRGKIVKYDKDGTPIQMIGCVKDITDSKKLEEQKLLLEKQSRLASLGEMMGNISHQWRQPLSVISSLVTSLELHRNMKTLDDTVLENTVNSVTEQVEYLSQTIDDFKNFIKNDRKSDVFSTHNVINKALSLSKAVIDRAYISIVIGQCDNKECIGYESEILQVLLNIINNAKDVLLEIGDEEKRFILIESISNKESVTIHIKDSAGGIPEKIIDRVFNPYFTTKDDSLGTGLGLYMSKKIVEDSMGTISVSNDIFDVEEQNYKGAHFVIEFPLWKNN